MSLHDDYRFLVDLYDANDLRRLVGWARQFLERWPDEGRFWQIYGTACWRLHDWPEALDALEEANTLIPLHPLAQFALADCYHHDGKSELAGVMYEYLSQIADDTSMLAPLAKRLGSLGRISSAIRTCRKITALDPSHHQGFFGIAYYGQQLGLPAEDRIEPLAKAMDLAPDVLQYRINLGLTWAEIGRAEVAHELLKNIQVEKLTCPCLIRRLRGVFESAGDHGRSLMCKVRLACLLQ